MRTTLELDDDLMLVVKHIAAERNESAGKVLSALARQGLQARSVAHSNEHGIPVLARKPGAKPVTTQHVRELEELDW